MKIKMLSIMSGPAGTVNPGDVVEFKDAEGHELIAAGYAVEVKSAPVVENKAAPVAENKALSSDEPAPAEQPADEPAAPRRRGRGKNK